MAKFIVFSNGALVGHSNLEHGDPPMGVAFGVFEPSSGYEAIASQCRSNHADQSALVLTVQTEQGAVIPCVGVGILDYMSKSDEPYIEVNVLGIDHRVYEVLFPGHIASYERRFPKQ